MPEIVHWTRRFVRAIYLRLIFRFFRERSGVPPEARQAEGPRYLVHSPFFLGATYFLSGRKRKKGWMLIPLGRGGADKRIIDIFGRIRHA